MKILLVSLAATALLVLGGCGGSSGRTSSPDPGVTVGGSTSGGITGGTVAPGSVALANASYIAPQSGGPVTITVNRNGGATGAVSIGYATSNGSASSGVDYTAVSGTLNWADGDTSAKSLAVPVSSAAPFSGSRTFTIGLSSPSGGAAVGSPASATITITGSGTPGSLALSASSYAVAQNAGAVAISVGRSGGSRGAVSVTYSTSNGSAVAGSDYTAASGTLSWADGDGASKSFSVSISNAAPYAGSKTFNVALSSASGASLGSPGTAVVTIAGSGPPASGAIGPVAAARLLTQGTFGPSIAAIDAAAGQSYDQWFAAQAAAQPSLTLPPVVGHDSQISWLPYWWQNVVQGPDALRQRVAFALSQILVTSNQNNENSAYYYDLLVTNALGNYRTLLEKVTLSEEMGVYLSMFRNDKANPALGTHADQNFAREVMQLFTVGLVQLNLDGTPTRDGSGKPIPTYGYADIAGMADALTGWASAPLKSTGEQAWRYDQDNLHPMVSYDAHHETAAKTIIGNTAIPAGGTAVSDLKIALDTLFNHPNVGPFLGRQLIQRLVTSNPSPAYVTRVASVFNNNGAGVRGDLLAVVRAILTDPEAVTPGGTTYGKLREPLLKISQLWRAFDARDSAGGDNEFLINQNALALSGEAPLQSPTVFNFFQPDYQRAGPLQAAGLVAPEFQILNENTLVLTANQIDPQAYEFVDSAGTVHGGFQGHEQPSLASVRLYTAAWEPYADSPATLVDKFNQVFMLGTMPAAMRSSLIDYANAIPTTESAYRARRVAETVDLLINSPQFSIQR
ncbi:MAG: hypothetical protein NVS9B10_20810 [Nevskia sp.]